MTIRPYRATDRDAVRHICCETADAGGPQESFFRDREFIADLVTRYYTDFAPELTWVVEDEGMVAGYLTGALDTDRQRRVTAWRILPEAVLRAVGRGVLFQRETWRMLRALIRSLFLGGDRAVAADLYPAHLHINLLPAARGQGMGQQLVEVFFAAARQAGVTGVQVSVRADNAGGCDFFCRLGFIEVGRRAMVLPIGGRWITTAALTYAKKL